MNLIPEDKDSILIVDDNPTNLDVLFTYLDAAGFNVLVAEDGESAIEQVQYTTPDIILLDVMMPGIDGFETCHRLKNNPETTDIPIIFMTALSDVSDKVKGFTEGAVDYVTKPFQHAEVLARVNTHLTIRKLQKSLEQRTQELQTRNQELDAFAHTLAHDLKNPLNILIGTAELVEFEGPLIESQKQCIETVIQTGYQINTIMNELLLLATLRDQDISFEPLDMATIIERCLERLQNLTQEHQVEIILPENWPASFGYTGWIEQVWINYISNAVKYGGRPPKVEIGSTSLDNSQIRFWVKDNGAGLTREEQSQLFVEFTRLKKVKIEGHGLGLSIARRIVERLGGMVGVESEVGQGSTFYFTLPAEE
ncbi:MAG: hybrid sensor histidine kinase/response regulator [Chloroflexota bacterium]